MKCKLVIGHSMNHVRGTCERFRILRASGPDHDFQRDDFMNFLIAVLYHLSHISPKTGIRRFSERF